MISDADISVVGQLIINELGKELIKQNHRATGNLIGSLDYKLDPSGAGLSLEITALGYAEFVNRGRKAGGKKVPINVLVEWIKQKGIETNNKKAVGIAFAIQNKIHKEGSPTKNRVRDHGKATNFIDDAYGRIEAEVSRRIAKLFLDKINTSIQSFIIA